MPRMVRSMFPPIRGDGFYQGTKRLWPTIVARAGLTDVTPHTLSHTLGSAAASGGEALLMVGALLGHANARSTQIDAHIDHDPARLAADRATAGISRIGPLPGCAVRAIKVGIQHLSIGKRSLMALSRDGALAPTVPRRDLSGKKAPLSGAAFEGPAILNQHRLIV